MGIPELINGLHSKYTSANPVDKAYAKKVIQSLNPKERQILLAWLEANSGKDQASPTPADQEKLKQKINKISIGKVHKKGFFRSIRISISTRSNKEITSKNLLLKIDVYSQHKKPISPAKNLKKPESSENLKSASASKTTSSSSSSSEESLPKKKPSMKLYAKSNIKALEKNALMKSSRLLFLK